MSSATSSVDNQMPKSELTVFLDGECTIYEVTEKQHSIMKEWTDYHHPIYIDLSAVVNIDVCFLQLLISCRKTAVQHNSHCYLLNVPDKVRTKIISSYLDSALLDED